MKIICIEGCHGCGKTEIVKKLAAAGFNTLDEGFLDMPQYTLPAQSLTMELMWVTRWISRALDLQKNHPDEIFFADRSPYSAMFYAADGDTLRPVLAKLITELSSVIHIITVYIDVDDTILWARISDRLLAQPQRKEYHENDMDWMIKVLSFYRREYWSYVIKNNESVENVMAELIKIANQK